MLIKQLLAQRANTGVKEMLIYADTVPKTHGFPGLDLSSFQSSNRIATAHCKSQIIAPA